MASDISAYSAKKLLQILAIETDHESDLTSEARIRLFKKWRDGAELGPLFALLASDVINERLQGAFYLLEAVPRDEELTKAAAELADDPLPYCRKAFVRYMTNTGAYGKQIAIGLAKCLMDFDPYVWLETINWAVYTTNSRFDDFSRLVTGGSESGHGHFWNEKEFKRGSKGLGIARRLRDGESVEAIRHSTPEEDDFAFDYLQVFERRLRRYVERRKSGALTNTARMSGPYDDFEIGVVGEVYDNLGMLKGDLPASVPPHVTDAQLRDMIDRCKESMRQRKFDQSALVQSQQK